MRPSEDKQVDQPAPLASPGHSGGETHPVPASEREQLEQMFDKQWEIDPHGLYPRGAKWKAATMINSARNASASLKNLQAATELGGKTTMTAFWKVMALKRDLASMSEKLEASKYAQQQAKDRVRDMRDAMEIMRVEFEAAQEELQETERQYNQQLWLEKAFGDKLRAEAAKSTEATAELEDRLEDTQLELETMQDRAKKSHDWLLDYKRIREEYYALRSKTIATQEKLSAQMVKLFQAKFDAAMVEDPGKALQLVKLLKGAFGDFLVEEADNQEKEGLNNCNSFSG